MFPSKKGRSIKKISASYMCLGFFSSSLSNVPSDRTLEKIPSQARTASSMFCFSCRFLLRLVVLVTDHTKPLERLNRGDRVEVPRHLIGSTWYIHWWNQYQRQWNHYQTWWNQYQRQWNHYQTWWNQYQIMFICYIITKSLREVSRMKASQDSETGCS